MPELPGNPIYIAVVKPVIALGNTVVTVATGPDEYILVYIGVV